MKLFLTMSILCIAFPTTVLSCPKVDIHCVILAGGNGERLWPLSRKDRPKQFLPLSNGKSIFENTLDRLESIKGSKQYWIVTTEALQDPLKKIAQQWLASNEAPIIDRPEFMYIAEPARRNTGPAILLASLAIAQRDPGAFIVFVYSDQHIPDHQAFAQSIHRVLADKPLNSLTLLGLHPTYPATGYGYIKYDKAQKGISPVLGFYEKPNLEVAKNYLASGDMLWNAGIFCGTARQFIEEYKKHAPQLVSSLEAFSKGQEVYENVPNISVDYAVFEKSSAITVLPVEFEWSDVGSVPTFLSLKGEPQDRSTLCIGECSRSFVETSKKLVALIDVEDICIAETEDVLMVTKCSSAERVKLIVEELKKDERYKDYL